MSDRFIVITKKPHIMRQGNKWTCLGLHLSRWWRGENRVFTGYGDTPNAAFKDLRQIINSHKGLKEKPE